MPLRTAAATRNSRTVAVLLSGTRDDGIAGLVAVKRCGGIVIAQHPTEARFGAGEQIFPAGAKADRFFLLREGKVVLSVAVYLAFTRLLDIYLPAGVLGF